MKTPNSSRGPGLEPFSKTISQVTSVLKLVALIVLVALAGLGWYFWSAADETYKFLAFICWGLILVLAIAFAIIYLKIRHGQSGPKPEILLDPLKSQGPQAVVTEPYPQRFTPMADYLKELKAHCPRYPYDFELVENRAFVDAQGNYTGTYRRKARNSTNSPVRTFTWELRVSERRVQHWRDIRPRFFVKVGDGKEQEVKRPRGHPDEPSRWLSFEVTFPLPVNVGQSFEVRLEFMWPQALSPGQMDGDGIDLSGYNSVALLVFGIKLERRVEEAAWYILDKSENMYLKKEQPRPVQEGFEYVLEEPTPELVGYGFECLLGPADEQGANEDQGGANVPQAT